MRNNSGYDEKFDEISFDDDARPLTDANGLLYQNTSPTIVNSPSEGYHEKTYLDETSPSRGHAGHVLGPSQAHERYLGEGDLVAHHPSHQAQQYDTYAITPQLPISSSQRQIYPMNPSPSVPERSLQDLNEVLNPSYPAQVAGIPTSRSMPSQLSPMDMQPGPVAADPRVPASTNRPTSLSIANPDYTKPEPALSTPAMGGDLYRHSGASSAVTQDSFYPYSYAPTTSHPSLEGSNFEFDRLNSNGPGPLIPALPTQPKGILKSHPAMANIPERPDSEIREAKDQVRTGAGPTSNQAYLTYQHGPNDAEFVPYSTTPRIEIETFAPDQEFPSRSSPPRPQQTGQQPSLAATPGLARKVSFKTDPNVGQPQAQAPLRPHRPDPAPQQQQLAPPPSDSRSGSVSPGGYRCATLSMFGMYDDDETGTLTYTDAPSELR